MTVRIVKSTPLLRCPVEPAVVLQCRTGDCPAMWHSLPSERVVVQPMIVTGVRPLDIHLRNSRSCVHYPVCTEGSPECESLKNLGWPPLTCCPSRLESFTLSTPSASFLDLFLHLETVLPFSVLRAKRRAQASELAFFRWIGEPRSH